MFKFGNCIVIVLLFNMVTFTGISQGYPKLANYLSGLGCEDTASAVSPGSGDQDFSSWDLLIMIMDNQGYAPAASVMTQWKLANLDLEILAYVDPVEFNLNAVELETDENGEINRLEHDLILEILTSYNEWWLLEPGSTITSDISASTRDIPVADISAFTLYARNAGSEDNPDPEASNYVQIGNEHMLITGINDAESTITVQRNLPGFPEATAHLAGSRIAAHVVYWEDTWMMNVTDSCPVVQGETWSTFLAGWLQERLFDDVVGSAIWTGVYLDCIWYDMSWLGTGPAYVDVDNDMSGESPETFNDVWHSGLDTILESLKSTLPVDGRIMINGDPELETLSFAQRANGCLFEQFPYKWTYQEYMDAYLAWDTSSQFPQLQVIDCSIIDEDPSPKTNYQLMRFGLTSCLMGNGYYGYDDGDRGHDKRWWYDEYDNVGQGKGYLGSGIQSAATLPNGCMIREFENGFAVCNPTAQMQIVDLPQICWKIQGNQDPVHNDGYQVSSINVASQDGYILLKNNSSSTPLTVALELSENTFYPGDEFYLWVEITKFTGDPISFDEYIMLDVYGNYWFWPDFVQLPDIDYQTHTMTGTETLLEQDALYFVWPDVQSSASGLNFYSMLFEPGTFNILSNAAVVSFGYDWP